MTAPDRATWTVAEDAEGEPTLWRGDVAVLRKYELGPPWQHGADLLWQVLAAVLAPDEATIERLASALYTADGDDPGRLEILPPILQRAAWDKQRRHVRAVLAALAGTSAQARHTDGDAAGGGER